MKKLRLDYKKTFTMGFGFLATSIAWSMYNAFVPPMLEHSYVPQIIARLGLSAGIGTTLTGLIMTIDNIFGVIFQPLFGTLSDKTRTKIGRRMPYITIGLPISAVLFALIPLMPSLAPFMFVLIAFNFVMSTWRAPVVALMPDLTPSPLRNQANGVINLMGGIGSILAFLLGGLLVDLWDPAPFIFSAAVMLAALVVLRIFVKEPSGEAAIRAQEEGEEELSIGDLPAEEKKARRRSLIFLLLAIFFWFNGFNAIETFFTLFATESLSVSLGAASMMLSMFSLTFVAVAIPAGFLANRIGRRRAITIGLIGMSLLFPSLLLIKNVMLVRALLLVGGAFWACVNINSLPMVLQMCSHKDIGKYTGYYYFFSFSASITAPILAGLLRDILKDYSSVLLYAGAGFLLALACMFFVRHGDVSKDKQTASDILDQMET